MAARNFVIPQLSATKGVVSVYCSVTFDGTSAPTLGTGAGNIGVKSFARTDVGLYTITFGTPSGAADTYMALLHAGVSFVGATPDAPIMVVVDPDSVDSDGTVDLRFNDYAGAATDPATGEIGLFKFDLRNSTAI